MVSFINSGKRCAGSMVIAQGKSVGLPYLSLIHILSTDDRAPLVSRTTQGMYPPGSALLPFILSTQLHLLQDESHSEAFLANLDVSPNCALPLGDDPTLAEMINHGCSGVMDDLMSLSNSTDLLLLYGDLGFFENPQLYLAVADTYSAQSELEKEDLIKEEAFLISPRCV